MKKLFETLSLVPLSVLVRCRLFSDYVKTVFRYYFQYPSFWQADTMMTGLYLCNNPYTISRKFMQEIGSEQLYVYGETPLSTMKRIVDAAGITADDTVYELGCGRGRALFWLRTVIGCRCIGVEHIFTFVEKAQQIQKRCRIDKMEFRLEDFVDTDLSGATVLYLYSTGFDDMIVESLLSKVASLPQGTKIITISYPLTEYEGSESFVVNKEIPVRFPWGRTTAYCHSVQN